MARARVKWAPVQGGNFRPQIHPDFANASPPSNMDVFLESGRILIALTSRIDLIHYICKKTFSAHILNAKLKQNFK